MDHLNTAEKKLLQDIKDKGMEETEDLKLKIKGFRKIPKEN